MDMLNTNDRAASRPPSRRAAALALVALLGAATTLAACNTTEGVGEDISAAGDALSRSADKAKGN